MKQASSAGVGERHTQDGFAPGAEPERCRAGFLRLGPVHMPARGRAAAEAALRTAGLLPHPWALRDAGGTAQPNQNDNKKASCHSHMSPGVGTRPLSGTPELEEIEGRCLEIP